MRDYRYVIEYFRADGTGVGQVPLTPDFASAVEWAHFDGVRSGNLPPVFAPSPTALGAVIDPVWHGSLGQPYVDAFQVRIPADRGAVEREIPGDYLHAAIQRGTATLVQRGAIRSGEDVRYLITAFPGVVATEPSQALPFQIEEIPQALPISEADLAPLLKAAEMHDASGGLPDDMPIIVAQRVVDEAKDLARQAGDLETGGVLIGKLQRDAESRAFFLVITAQIAALHTDASSMKLTFTAETWGAARTALALRRRDEGLFGWWHSHPDFCRLRNCPMERRQRCLSGSRFFSGEDVALTAALFGRAFHCALLVSDSAATGLVATMFGWRRGSVVSRAYHTITSNQGE